MLGTYEFLRILEKEIPSDKEKHHNITINKDSEMIISVMFNGKNNRFILTYLEIRDKQKIEIIDNIKNVLNI